MTQDNMPIVSRATPSDTAKLFLADTSPNLIHHLGDFLDYDTKRGCYFEIEAQTVQSNVRAFLDSSAVIRRVKEKGGDFYDETIAFAPKVKDVAEVMAAIEDQRHVPQHTMSPPTWLPGTPENLAKLNPKRMVCFSNGLLDLDTRTLYQHTPFFFTMTSLNVAYFPDAPKPEKWLRFLAEVTDGRPELIDLVRQMAGYLIGGDLSLQKVFMLWGRQRSGKGTILRILGELLGSNNIAAPTIQSLAGQFGRHNLIGKTAAFVTDMNCESRSKLSEAASTILQISGEDTIDVERKNKTTVSVKVLARFVLASNMLPNFQSHTTALASRLLIVPFDVSFAGKEDTELTDKLRGELSGILNWALAGLDDLQLAGNFAEPEACREAKRMLFRRTNLLHTFVEEQCDVDLSHEIDKEVFRKAYARFCLEHEQRPMGETELTEKLRLDYPTTKASKRRAGISPTGSDRFVPTYKGIRLKLDLAPAFYRIDRDLFELGLAEEAIIRDKHGAPVPLEGAHAVDDFEE